MARAARAVALASAMVLIAAGAARAQTIHDWPVTEADGSTSIIDSDGHVGTLQTNNDASGVVVSGGQLVFDGNGRVVVPNDAALNPGTDQFSVSVAFTTSVIPSTAVGDYDMVRKGLSTDSQSYWKVELVANSYRTKAWAKCQVRGYNSTLLKYVSASLRTSGNNLADGQPHVIACAKTDLGLTLSVDGVVKVTSPKSVGRVQNGADLSIGAKAAVWEDEYTGSIDDVSYSIG